MKHFSSKVAILVVLALVFSMLPITNLFLISDAAEPTPVFTDGFENKINTDSSLSSSIYKLTIQSSNKVSFVTGKVGSGVHLDALSSYIGYSAKYINPEEGTIRFYFKPDSNLYDFYNTRQAEWKDYGSYKSPFSGIMLDEVGFLGAFSGAFGSYINFPGDKNNKNISIGFQTWSGSTWSQATFTTKDNFVLSSDKFYDFAFTWSKSEGTIKIYIDGELKASGSYNTPLSSKELFFIGHIPFQNYYPYGPHSLIGTYDELRIYNTALKDFGTIPPVNPPVTGSCDLFSDDFNRSNIGSNWTIVDDQDSSQSNWSVSNGVLSQLSNTYRSSDEYSYYQGTHIVTGNSNWSNYSFSFDVTPTDDDGVGIIVRYQDKNNYYRFLMVEDYTNGGPFRRIDKIVNNQPFQILAIDKKNSFDMNKKYRVTFNVFGNNLQVLIDGVEILKATDSTFTKGKAGMMTYACSANFDNVCVSSQGGTVTPPVVNPNKPPKGLRAYPGDGKVALEWDPPEDTNNLSGYYLYRSKQSGVYSDPAFDFPTTDTKYTDENVDNGTTYYYICKVVYKDKTQSPPSNEVSVTPKTLVPTVNITDNQKVNSSSFTFTGKVDAGSTVLVNGKSATVDSNGNFTATVTLNKGSNSITIEVKNKAGDSAKVTKTVTYEESTTPPTTGLKIVLVINNKYMTVNGTKKEIDPGRDTVPVIVKGRTLVPIRAIIEEMGGTVDWSATDKKVTIKLGNVTIELWIDKKTAKVNGTSKELDVVPQIVNGRTMLPLRFVSEELGCSVDWNGDTKTVTIVYSGSTTQNTTGAVEKTFTSSGGELKLSDGTKLSVPAGAFTTDTKISVASVPSAFGKDSKGIDISGLQNLKGEITLTFSTEKGLSKEEVSVFGYDSSKDTTFDITNSYDSSTGIVTVKISPSALTLGASINRLLSLFSTQNSQGIIDRLSVVFEKTESYIPKKSEYLIQMPYYGQVGEACWVACTNMLIHGYMGAQAGEPVSKTLNYIKVDEDNFGIGVSGFTNTLPNYISIQTNGKKVTWRGFSFSQHMQWEILRQLDAGHPIIMRYLASKHPHTVLIIGYKNKGADIDLIIHDPQNVVPDSENGTMYTVEPWSWVERHISLYRKACQLLWIDESLSSAKTLQTIECSGGDEAGGNPYGSISFNTVNVRNNREVLLATLKFRPSVASGYTWENAGKVVEVISGQASKLKMQLPVWNASFEDKKLSVTVQINTGATKLYSNDKSISVGTASYNSEAKKTYTIDIPLEEVRNVSLGDAKGIQNITLYVNLNEGSTEKDKFFIDAKLSLIPIVESIDPTSGKVGDTITISGFSFGKNKSTKSRVTINDKDVDIVSWSDKEIKVKLTQDVGNGPVVVYTGEKYEYVSNKDVTFGMASPCDKSYEVYCTEVPLWNSMDCKWDSSKQLIRLCVTLKSGKVSGTGSTCYGNSQEVSGTYDASGNITFTFTWKGSYGADDTRGFIVTGTFTGKLAKGCTFSGTAKGTARAYDKSPMYCKPYDLKQDFSSPMYDKNYKP